MPKTKADRAAAPPVLEFQPLTPGRWDDFAALFGPKGGCGGCWCMWWRERQGTNEANRAAMQRIVEQGPPPGLLAYAATEAGPACVGWIALAPRPAYAGLARSRILRPVDDAPVWSVTCFFIHKAWRKQGVSTALLRAAADWARTQGAQALEGYPHEPEHPQPDAFVWTGLAAAFRAAGFVEAARRSAKRPIMRLDLA
jgi:GNAT superfamily N-acetyltransferase